MFQLRRKNHFAKNCLYCKICRTVGHPTKFCKNQIVMQKLERGDTVVRKTLQGRDTQGVKVKADTEVIWDQDPICTKI